jgi:hypothetical protein
MTQVQFLFFQVSKKCVVAKAAVTAQEGNVFVAQALSGVGQKALDVVG